MYKVLDILKDLPGTNCKDCGKGNCFAFATQVFLGSEDLAHCKHLDPEKLYQMQLKLEEARARGDKKKDSSTVQALNFLRGKIADMDFSDMAAKSGAAFVPPNGLRLPFYTETALVTAQSIKNDQGFEYGLVPQIFLYIYVTRATGAPPTAKFISYRELPNSVSKTKTFEKTAEEIAGHFATVDEIVAAGQKLGGNVVSFGSADLAMRFTALPRVEFLLLYWNKTDEFPARSTMLLDSGILDYLDQEAIVFLAEAFVRMMKGENIHDMTH